jgi:hypothetical protein
VGGRIWRNLSGTRWWASGQHVSLECCWCLVAWVGFFNSTVTTKNEFLMEFSKVKVGKVSCDQPPRASQSEPSTSFMAGMVIVKMPSQKQLWFLWKKPTQLLEFVWESFPGTEKMGVGLTLLGFSLVEATFISFHSHWNMNSPRQPNEDLSSLFAKIK